METIIPAWIPATPCIALVGQSPGRVEGRTGIPFTGPAGHELRGRLEAVGFDTQTDCLFTNVCATFYPDDPNHVPTAQELAEGGEAVRRELAAAPSLRVVVLLGASACHLTGHSEAMGKLHGRQTTITDADGRPLPTLLCYHPSYYLRLQRPQTKAEVGGAIQDVFMRAKAIVDGGPGITLPTPEYVEELSIGR